MTGLKQTITISAKAKDKSGKESDVVTEELLVRGVNAKPTVDVLMPAEEFTAGETVRIELVGKDDEGLTRMWWYASVRMMFPSRPITKRFAAMTKSVSAPGASFRTTPAE